MVEMTCQCCHRAFEAEVREEPACHRLVCGDSTQAEDVARLMGGAQADCVWTDPPYGVSYVGKTKDALTIPNDGVENLSGFLADAFKAIDAALLPGAAVYVA